jgi:hypothetical protein
MSVKNSRNYNFGFSCIYFLAHSVNAVCRLNRRRVQGSSAPRHRPSHRSSSHYPTETRSSRQLRLVCFHPRTDDSCKCETRMQRPSPGGLHVGIVRRIAEPEPLLPIQATHDRAGSPRPPDLQLQSRGVLKRLQPTGIGSGESLGKPSHQYAVFAENLLNVAIQARCVLTGGQPRLQVKNIGRK